MKQPSEIKPAKGKLGVLLPGFGAVATTFVVAPAAEAASTMPLVTNVMNCLNMKFS